jgi:hypothetical protein
MHLGMDSMLCSIWRFSSCKSAKLLLLLFILTAVGSYPWKWYYNKTQHTNKHITHDAQTKHNTESYSNNKGLVKLFL